MSIVTISRGSLSGGQAIAESVAQQLGFRCIGSQTLVERASQFGVPEPTLTRVLEKAPTFWERLTESRELYLAFLRAAMCDIAEGGRLVYHGQAGHELLKGVDHVLRVRVVAPLDQRVTGAMQSQHLSREAALEYIQRIDDDRLRRMRYLFNVDWRDPLLYDIVVNLENMPVEQAAGVVANLAQQPQYQPTQKSEKAFRDLALASRVKATLIAQPNGWDVDVSANDGAICLRGEVGVMDPSELEVIAHITRDVPGVKSVDSDIAPRLIPPAISP